MWARLALFLAFSSGISLVSTKTTGFGSDTGGQATSISNGTQKADNATNVPVIGQNDPGGYSQHTVTLTQDTPTYNLYSPGFPDKFYPANTQKYYDVAVQLTDPVAQLATRIMVTFEMLALEPSDFCSKDGVEIYDPNYQTRVYCGSQSGRILLTESTTVRIRFFSDAENEERGFSLNVRLFPSSCTQTFADQLQGSFSSPQFPKNYANNELCVWKIQAPPGKSVRVDFNAIFQIQGTFPSCGNDYLEVSRTGDLMIDSERLCGTQAPEAVISEGSTLLLRFISDCCFQNSGFSASFTIIDGAPPPTPEPLVPTNCDCGKENVKEERIVNGENVSPPHRFPWMCALFGDSNFLACGAALISVRYAITAAHCEPDPQFLDRFKVLLGAYDLTATPMNQVEIDKFIIHPGYNTKNYANDIALIRFTEDIKFSHDVSPICLPSGNFPTTDLQVIVSGWGSKFPDGPRSNTLMMAELNTIPLPQCMQQYSGTTASFDSATLQHLCATNEGQTNLTKDACQGDSGGPLITRVDGRWIIVGVTSFSIGCGNKRYPGVYVNVPSYVDWITENTQDGPACVGVEPLGPLQPNIQDCGLTIRHISTRIVGGTPTQSDYPWMAFIVVIENGTQHPGAGVLISPKFVLTAMNWMQKSFPDRPDLFIINLGRYDLQKDESATARAYSVTKVHVNPGYNSKTFDLEMALLELTKEVNDVFRPVCLPTSLSVPDDSPATVIGWGENDKGDFNNILQEIDVQIVNLKQCKKKYEKQINLSNNMICAGKDGKGNCKGDGGAPLMLSRNGRYYLMGLASFGSTKGCALKGIPDVYSAIIPSLDWISKITGLKVK